MCDSYYSAPHVVEVEGGIVTFLQPGADSSITAYVGTRIAYVFG
jgi:hypothetical protein